MKTVYFSSDKGEHNDDLFEIVKNAAVHAFAPFAEKCVRRRLTAQLGYGYYVCLTNDEDMLVADYDDITKREDWARQQCCQVGIIVINPEKGGTIEYYHHDTGVIFEACRANYDVERTDRDKELELAFIKCLREAFANSKRYCILNS